MNQGVQLSDEQYERAMVAIFVLTLAGTVIATMTGIIGLLLLVLIGAVVIWQMLRVTAGRGGEQLGDAAESASQVISQMQAFRGDDPAQRPAWDGVERLKGVEGNDSGGG